MKLAHPEMENVIEISRGSLSTLVIENRYFFRNFVADIYQQINGETGKLVLSDGLKICNFAKDTELIDSIISLELNTKTLQNKILTAMENIATSGEMYLETSRMLGEIENYIDMLSQELPCDIVGSKINVTSLLKMVGLSVRDEYENTLERIVDYMELVREFDRDKLFIFVNMRTYFTDVELESFIETTVQHEYRVLLIDGITYSTLLHEKRLTVDEDLCEF